MVLFEFHQDIHVTAGTKIIPQHGAEKGQTLDVVLLTELHQLAGVHIDMELVDHLDAFCLRV